MYETLNFRLNLVKTVKTSDSDSVFLVNLDQSSDADDTESSLGYDSEP